MPSTGSCARSAGCSTAPGAASCCVSGADAAEYLQGQLTNDVEALEPGEGSYAALLDRKGHMQADMRVLRPSDGRDSGSTPSRRRSTAARRHLQMYKIGREVEVDDVSGERAILSLIGPRSVEIAGTAALPEHACEPTAVGGGRVPSPSAPRDGHRPDRRRPPKRDAPARGAARRRRGRGRRRGGRDPPDRGRHAPASAPRWAPRRCPPRPASSSARSASPRAATSARRRSPASTTRAGPTATCAGCG